MEYFGKYRAIVSNINDPEFRGRIKVRCPKAYGEYESPWCIPCSPFPVGNGGLFMIPSIGSMVWVEFEEGLTKNPIYTGGWWAVGEAPFDEAGYNAKVGKVQVIQTPSGHRIEFDDRVGFEKVTIHEKSGAEIVLEDGTVTVTGNLSATLVSPSGGGGLVYTDPSWT